MSIIQESEIVLCEPPNFFNAMGLTPYEQPPNNEIFTIVGDLCQIAHVHLEPDQKMQLEPGAMCYMSEDCKLSTQFGGFSRMLTEGDIFKQKCHNNGPKHGYIGITANIPATIIPINLDTMGGSIKCKHDAFLGSHHPDIKIGMSRLKAASCAACCCSGIPMVLQNVQGNGWIFLACHGTIMQKTLAANEEIVVDSNCVVALSSAVTVDVVSSGGCCTCCFGGDGLFNTSLKGPGLVLLSSMPLEKLRKLFIQPPDPNKKKAAGGDSN